MLEAGEAALHEVIWDMDGYEDIANGCFYADGGGLPGIDTPNHLSSPFANLLMA